MELRALLLLPLCFPGLRAQTPDAEEERLEGSSLFIRCPYTAYTQYQKAWSRLREGQWKLLLQINPTQNSHTTQASKGKVTIVDNPTDRTVSINMTNLQTEDSGTYSCGLRYYYNGYYPLKTIALNVFKELHKMELDSLSVQCPYGKLGYSTGTKAWCQREGRTGCKVLASTDYYYPSTRSDSKALGDRAFIQDDTQKRSVTITMEKLQAQDTGTYWCAHDPYPRPTRIMEVRLSVSKSEYLLAATRAWWQISASSPSCPAPPHQGAHSSVNNFILLSGVLSILFILALTSLITLGIRHRKQLKRRGNRQAEDTYDKPDDIAQLDSTERMESPEDDSKDIKYVTLNFNSQLSPEDPLYCNVEPRQAPRKPKDENVDYAIIALK
ncbi:TREM1 protein, partial [Lophotis ruficrista]|nr:TREM1 protein [Lophotis ruficrista]